MSSKKIFALLAAFAWISINEFVRNQFFFKHLWEAHYQSVGLTFPADPANGAIWGLWSLLLASLVYVLLQKFSLWQTTVISWIAGFVMMWLVIGNLGVLPYAVLPYAIPWSLLEGFGAAWIIEKIKGAIRIT